MKLPKRWHSNGGRDYSEDRLCSYPRQVAFIRAHEMHDTPEGWYFWRRKHNLPTGPFKTAREAFAALGVEVPK